MTRFANDTLATLDSTHTVGKIVRDTARAHVGGVHAGARHPLVELHHLLALLEQPQERRQGTNILFGGEVFGKYCGGGWLQGHCTANHYSKRQSLGLATSLHGTDKG